MDQNGSKWIKMDQNGSKLLKSEFGSVLIELGLRFGGFFEEHQSYHKAACDENGDHFLRIHLFDLLQQHLCCRDVDESPCGDAHEEGHHELPLLSQEYPHKQAQHVHGSLKENHADHNATPITLSFVNQAQSQTLRPFVDQNGRGQTESSERCSLESDCQGLKECVDGHSCLKNERLPIFQDLALLLF